MDLMTHPLAFVCLSAIALCLINFDRGILKEAPLHLRLPDLGWEGVYLGLGFLFLGGAGFASIKMGMTSDFEKIKEAVWILLAYGYVYFTKQDKIIVPILFGGAWMMAEHHFNTQPVFMIVFSAVLGVGIGLVRVLLASLQYRLLFSKVPKPLQGYPIFFLCAMFVTLILWVFAPTLDVWLN